MWELWGAGSVEDATVFSRSHAGFHSALSLILSSWVGLHVSYPPHCCRLSKVTQALMLRGGVPYN